MISRISFSNLQPTKIAFSHLTSTSEGQIKANFARIYPTLAKYILDADRPIIRHIGEKATFYVALQDEYLKILYRLEGQNPDATRFLVDKNGNMSGWHSGKLTPGWSLKTLADHNPKYKIADECVTALLNIK